MAVTNKIALMLHQNFSLQIAEFPRLLILAGPTASGKTQVSLELCEILDGEIISADSLLIYRGLDIGTAKPSAAERARAPHHLIDILLPDAEYSAAQWAQDAMRLIGEINSRRKQPIIVGGTGFYLTALLRPQRLASAPPNAQLREEMELLAAREGNGVLHARLREVDEAAANRLHPNDNMRVVRAIEVAQFRLENSMENLLHSDDCERENDMEIPALEYSAFGLEMSREKLYARVDARVDAMLADGFLSELSTLIETGYGQSAPLQSLGYKQMRDALTDSSKLEEGVGIWKRQTRRYAKRQLTWFRHQLDVRWIAAEKPGGELRDAREIARQIADEFLGVV